MTLARTVLLLVFITTVSPALASAGGWTLASSTALTATTPVDPTQPQERPRAVATADGFCAAWLDRRQGGSILATRIDLNGNVLDPMSLPVALVRWQASFEVLDSPVGCVVVHGNDHWSPLTWTLIPDEPAAMPRVFFEVAKATFILAAGRDRVLVQRSNPSGGFLVSVISSQGELLSETVVEAPFESAAANGNEFFAVSSSDFQSDDSTAQLQLWRMGLDLELTPIGPPFRDASSPALGASADRVLLAWPRWSTLRGRVAVFSTEGSELSRLDFDLPLNAGQPTVEFDGAFEIRWQSWDRPFSLRTDGDRILESGLTNVVERAVAATEGRVLHVRQLLDRRLEYEVTTGEPIGTGEPISHYPLPELLVDADDDGDRVALLWRQIDTRGNRERLWVAVSSKLGNAPLDPRLVAEVEIPYGGGFIDAAVAMQPERATVVWVSPEGLVARRLGADGSWIDPVPLTVYVPAEGMELGLSPHGLDAGEGRLALVFTESKLSSRLLATTAESGGIFSAARELTVEGVLEPKAAAITRVRDRYVVAWSSPPLPCHITCPGELFEVGGGLYGADFGYVRNLVADDAFSSTRPILASEGDRVLMALDWYSSMVYEVDAAGGISGRPLHLEIPLFSAHQVSHAPSSITSIPGGFLLTMESRVWPGETGFTTGFTTGWRIDGSKASGGLVFSGAEDWSSFGVLASSSYTFPNNGSLLVFSAGVSLNPSEGIVRRLRAHEMAPSGRRRAVARSAAP